MNAFVKERRRQIAKNKIRVVKKQTELTDQQIHDYAVFELGVRAFEIQSGWCDASENKYEYTIRDLFIGKFNSDKFSQRLEEMNKYLDYIPLLKSNPKRMAYGQALPDDEIKSSSGDPFHQNGQ
jgi:hypothetical protein